jgi:hypothetical protein
MHTRGWSGSASTQTGRQRRRIATLAATSSLVDHSALILVPAAIDERLEGLVRHLGLVDPVAAR